MNNEKVAVIKAWSQMGIASMMGAILCVMLGLLFWVIDKQFDRFNFQLETINNTLEELKQSLNKQ